MQLRPYQEESKNAVLDEWERGVKKTLLVLPTGCGKTIVFSKIIEERVSKGDRVLILAHRGELLDQASDKLEKATGLKCAVEKAEDSSLGSWYRVVVGSVQSLQREKRLFQFNEDHFDTIVVDEAHHCISDGYQKVLNYFNQANVLGVTATPDRGDMKNLGSYFETLAYEYSLPQAIKDGYLSPIKAQTIPLKIDISKVGQQTGDFKTSELGTALDPYLEGIVEEMKNYCMDRKTVVFLPLIATSKKMCDLLNKAGFKAAEVNGDSKDREDVLRDFEKGKYNVLCNSMLLTEGWDCPSVDCVIVLRPTKVRSLYCLDTETEVLTKEGWKKNVEVGEEVAAFNTKTNEIKFTSALAKIRRPLEKDEFFVNYRSPSMDIRVTNKHRMIYDNKRKKGWKFKTAEELAGLASGSYIPVSGYGKFNGVPLTDDELRFIGWVMSDGTINPLNGQVTITQGAHQKWVENIDSCLQGCGFKHNRFTRKRNSKFKSSSDAVVWTISKGKPRGKDKHLTGWGRLEDYLSKDLSEKLHDMTEQQFDVFLEAIHQGDGAKQEGQSWTRRSYHISTGNLVFAEKLQVMALMRGYKANISKMNYNKKPLYYIHLKKKTMANIGQLYDNRPVWEKESYKKEETWCVENELGTLVTRRNGKVSIVGNCQMVGRGTRLCEGKEHLLLLDFLWHTEKHELCHPAHLIVSDDLVAKKMTDRIEDSSAPVDVMEVEEVATIDALQDREESLAEKLKAMRSRKRKLVDPLQFEFSIQSEDLANYQPAFGWEMGPPTTEQVKTLEKLGIFSDEIENAGKANLLINRLDIRRIQGLTTPKQIRFLEQRGFNRVGEWEFEGARKLINRIAANGWRNPKGIDPANYKPEPQQKTEELKMPW